MSFCRPQKIIRFKNKKKFVEKKNVSKKFKKLEKKK